MNQNSEQSPGPQYHEHEAEPPSPGEVRDRAIAIIATYIERGVGDADEPETRYATVSRILTKPPGADAAAEARTHTITDGMGAVVITVAAGEILSAEVLDWDGSTGLLTARESPKEVVELRRMVAAGNELQDIAS